MEHDEATLLRLMHQQNLESQIWGEVYAKVWANQRPYFSSSDPDHDQSQVEKVRNIAAKEAGFAVEAYRQFVTNGGVVNKKMP